MHDWLLALLGGIIIGLASSLLLLLKGRIFGITGIIYGVLTGDKNEKIWRFSLILGLISGGVFSSIVFPQLYNYEVSGPIGLYILAGLLVGFGTKLGSGCTSGHGVCGISRLSPRSIVATLVFMASGIVTVLVKGAF